MADSLPGPTRWSGGGQRTWPSPVTTYLVEVISGSPIGPRAWSFWVLIPISAPKPNSPPSVKRVEALTSTAAASTSATKRRSALVAGDDRLGVARREAPDVGECGVEVGYDGGRDVEAEVLTAEVVVRGRDHSVVRRERGVAVDRHAGALQGLDDAR